MSSFSFDYCFLAEYLPVRATSSTALNKQCHETILVNKEGNSWNVSLRFSESGGKYYITRGWRKFCLDNNCKIGDLFVFNVVGDEKTTPLMCVCPERKECSEILSKYLSRTSGDESETSRPVSWFTCATEQNTFTAPNTPVNEQERFLVLHLTEQIRQESTFSRKESQSQTVYNTNVRGEANSRTPILNSQSLDSHKLRPQSFNNANNR
ncbi:hypothetical protein YC2023_103783 [Brassica napus]